MMFIMLFVNRSVQFLYRYFKRLEHLKKLLFFAINGAQRGATNSEFYLFIIILHYLKKMILLML